LHDRRGPRRGLAGLQRAAIIVAATGIAAAPAAAQDDMAGATVFVERCAVCHQQNGEGVPGVYPPINETLGHFMATEPGRRYLGEVMTFGLAGAITVGGQPYIGQMKLVPSLSDREIVEVLNYALTAFSTASLPPDAAPFSVDEIASLRATPKVPTDVARSRQAVVDELEQLGRER
jgi:mono/diheme cytochrome c family protein